MDGHGFPAPIITAEGTTITIIIPAFIITTTIIIITTMTERGSRGHADSGFW